MIVQIPLTISNAFLIKGARPILVDTGSPDEAGAILVALKREHVEVRDLALIVHTHGHSDHCGSTWELKQISRAPTAIHKSDADMLRRGRNNPVIPTNLTARVIRSLFSQTFRRLEPDILIANEMDLGPYGVNGRIIFSPGHTAGSISVVLENNEAIAGDLMMGGYLGGQFFPGLPGYPYFADDLNTLRASIKKLMGLSVSRVYVGHGGPLEPRAIIRRFSRVIDF